MADWALPTLSSGYSDFLTYLKARDSDAASLGYAAITNPETGQMRYVRASNKFQEYDGASWVDKLVSIAGGGTGSSTAANARTALGLGTIATQDANNVAITGGSISGVSANASIITAGNLAIARFPASGTWTLTGRLLISGHETKHDGLGIGYRSGGSTTLTDTDGTYVCTGGTVTFPSAALISGRIAVVKRDGTAVTFATTSSQTLDGVAPGSFPALDDKEAVIFQADGSNWKVIGRTGLSNVKSVQVIDNTTTYAASGSVQDVTLGTILTSFANAVVIMASHLGAQQMSAKLTSTSNVRITADSLTVGGLSIRVVAYIVEYKNVS